MTHDDSRSNPSDPDVDEHDRFIRAINFQYQKLYSNVTLVILLLWVVACAVAFFAFGFGGTSVALSIGSLLLSLFALRAVIHTRGRGLQTLVEGHLKEHEMPLSALLETARSMSPSADFFVSLMDGPLARQRRLNASGSVSST
ncbi:MAG: hypothetical protein AUK47_23230 [Deltaproteobacteria bacterium CG2_30_63_29]|nr:MAG: hypothetical protein AUK47_23230 [Deltaproteobacteria bacterium CG2_30_63_29]PIW01009.1 MAG: hypothetical protein COW42_06215 [Deltaproteobacteria bacterium CG17_big_fil_post_rev_8_21_14_2_50_63_7]PJB46521.1 MAG: hypothetical protein CO108_05695 [Deltaproteobacteria bacterium CG_4_9_14_3_um_filter_63_12]